ncbi:MAG: GNAT family N-acetyltransferase [Asticcacaulis sp.]
MLSCRSIPVNALSEDALAIWKRFQMQTPAFASPLLSPEFASLVSTVRQDARIILIEQDNSLVGILAGHLRPGGTVRPIGAPFADFNALLSAPGVHFDARATLRRAGISEYVFGGLIDPYGLFGPNHPFVQAQTDLGTPALSPPEGAQIAYSLVLDQGQSPEAFIAALRSLSPKKFKNMMRLENKLDREVGTLSLRVETPDANGHAALETLLNWKSRQAVQTGIHDFVSAHWIRALFRTALNETQSPLKGLMLSLYAGDRLVAGHFGVRMGAHFHPWVAAFDPDMAAYSPGTSFLFAAIRAMPGLGLTHYDLAAGHDAYKAPFCNQQTAVYAGRVFGTQDMGRLRQGALMGLESLGRLGGPLWLERAQRLTRRLDQIAMIELETKGRLAGLRHAFSHARTRLTTADAGGVDGAG